MNKPKNILIVTYWSFSDALIQTYTLPYLELILKTLPPDSSLFLLTLDKDKITSSYSTKNKAIKNISIQYKSFGFKGFIMWGKIFLKLLRLIRKENISTIHCWCTPAGMIGYILSIFTGKELIIDSYEPHAEAMIQNGAWKKNSFAFKLLFKFEKLQTSKAKYLIAASEGMKQYANDKFNHSSENILVKPACVNLELFSFKNKKNKQLIKNLHLENKIVCVYAGKFGGIYLDYEVFDFFKAAETYWKDNFKVLILSSQLPNEINYLKLKSGLKPETVIVKYVEHSQIPNYIGLADFAITPVKSVPSKKYCSPIKDGEYWALGLPVVITKDISDDSGIIEDNNIGSILYELNENSYFESIKNIDFILKNTTPKELYKKIRLIAEKYRNFEIAAKVYNYIYGNK